MAKYTYKANPNSPLGQEASLKQGEKILILQEHPVTAYANDWVNVHTISGSKGYVPKSYVHVPEGGLPWLANQKLVSSYRQLLTYAVSYACCKFMPRDGPAGLCYV